MLTIHCSSPDKQFENEQLQLFKDVAQSMIDYSMNPRSTEIVLQEIKSGTRAPANPDSIAMFLMDQFINNLSYIALKTDEKGHHKIVGHVTCRYIMTVAWSQKNMDVYESAAGWVHPDSCGEGRGEKILTNLRIALFKKHKNKLMLSRTVSPSARKAYRKEIETVEHYTPFLRDQLPKDVMCRLCSTCALKKIGADHYSNCTIAWDGKNLNKPPFCVMQANTIAVEFFNLKKVPLPEDILK